MIMLRNYVDLCYRLANDQVVLMSQVMLLNYVDYVIG